MALVVKSLGTGQLGTSEGDLLATSLAAGKAAIVKNVILVNTNTSAAVTIDLYVKRGSNATVRISPVAVSLPPGGAYVHDVELTLLGDATNPDKLRGKASAATTVDYVVNGVERDQ